MMKKNLHVAVRPLSILLIILAMTAPSQAAALEVKQGDHIAIVGGTLGQRLAHFGYWENLLHQRFADKQLVVRNLCFDADEAYDRPRSQGFGSPDDHLKHSKASVILYCFGLVESFKGQAGVAKFKADITKLVQETKSKDYSGNGAPRIVLVSPIAAEDIGNPNLPDAKKLNANLKLYADALADVATKTGVGFADVFTPTAKAFAGADHWTFNGVHMTEAGYKRFAPILDQALFGSGTPKNFDEKLAEQIADKNFHWWMRYRALDGFYIYGGRSRLKFQPDTSISNNDVCEREREILDEMTANRDRRVWAVAQGKPLSSLSKAVLNDTNTQPFIKVKTNFGGKQKKQGKEGTLAYLSAAEQTKQFKPGKGYKVNCFASEEDFPELVNPVQFAFDSKGRCWVTVMPSYPHWKPKTKLDDKVLILEDTDGDGKADKCTTFARGLHVPTGIELGDGGAYVAQMPYLIHYKDTDGDDVADTFERVMGGFDSADTHHQASAFTWGPGGGLYFQEGTFHRTQVETPWGALRLHDGGVFRYDPTRQELDAFISYGFANPWGHVFDNWGQNFVADASPGQNYLGTAFSGHVDHPEKHSGGRSGRKGLKMPTFIKKRFRPTSGCEIVSSRHFPDAVQGNYVLNNVIGALGVYQHTMHDQGSGFIAKEIEPIVECSDRNFRPVDLQFGPDGALYLVDWHNALIGHMQHSIRDPSRDVKHGRIWRVTYPSRPLVKVPDLTTQSIGQLLDLLKSYEDRTRYRVRRELRERGAKAVTSAVKQWVLRLDKGHKEYQHHLLEALWVQQHFNQVDLGLLKQLLQSPDARARAAATRVLCYTRHRISESDMLKLLEVQVNDKHPRVRLEAVRACSFLKTAKAAAVALQATKQPMDEYLNYTLTETLNTLKRYQ